ncbi:glycogen/starch/alpha-glucan phosphorylase [Borrelia sp. RT1S]|uniref:glycogen/starch/alpha-glucan phosphorylase n=1 Tax=Borrelia sp. RT1S TaxID=2898580 RepID=UPI001E343B2D|nr:glycogen/starch/alpha-glucan phosphorylase [Borrelia sp. RT1S]UGQ17605.1 glycogen/starch/alpha-glucan phosphorylase [Borrelia sp. RT1S]
MHISKEDFKARFNKNLKCCYQVESIKDLSGIELYNCFSRTVIDYFLEDWANTKLEFDKKRKKKVCYLSAEFLLGRFLSNTLINMGSFDVVESLSDELGIDFNELENIEIDAGLGNGGLGRLAACFLESLSTLDYPALGYGIKYRYGIFKQSFVDGYQVEEPDKWSEYEYPWVIKNIGRVYDISFGGHIEIERDFAGNEIFTHKNPYIVNAIAYDAPIVGYNSKTINTLRLWEAYAKDGFDLGLFNNMQYFDSSKKEMEVSNITKILYPNDEDLAGKFLRLRQQYFFCSASIQDVIHDFKQNYSSDLKRLPEYVVFQLNDTHPVVAIPELMRILIDREKFDWKLAWKITRQCFAYTNHTILAEALEKWPLRMFSELLPRIYQIIQEINKRFFEEIEAKNKMGSNFVYDDYLIINNGVINMAWLAIHSCFSVNGVAKLHTEILTKNELKHWYDLYPDKFNNKTNGVTQRRWLLLSNPRLSKLVSSRIGDSWVKKFDDIEKFLAFKDDKDVISSLKKIRHENKVDFSNLICRELGIKIDPNSIFDVQIKRLHEYKRQVLNALHILYLYNQLKRDKNFYVYPRTFIFGAKAAPGYRMAKNIIKFINDISNKVNNDSDVNDKIKVIFIPNYNVSWAEKIIAASDVSEQISLAGKEASGTSNMKFMMNGALTIGTMDGANVEIYDQVGDEHMFIFGLRKDEVMTYDKNHSYVPNSVLESDPELAEIISSMVDGKLFRGHYEVYKEIHDSLLYESYGGSPDRYFVLKDFRSYVCAQKLVESKYRDPNLWFSSSLVNIAKSSVFSSDRTIENYVQDIWKLKRLH